MQSAMEKRLQGTEQPERTRSGRTYVPAVDIIEMRDELLLLADVPGVRAEDIEINYERGELRLLARVQPRHGEQTNYLFREYGTGDFVRSFQVGEGIDAVRIAAEVRDGVLHLHLPKAEAAKTRKIAVKSH
jgi:HSP20 family protein